MTRDTGVVTSADVRSPEETRSERGREATRPGKVPISGWLDVLKRTRQGIRETNASIIAAGVAFYAFLALVPALIAVMAIYALVANPADVKEQITSFASAAPRDVQRLLSNQLSTIARDAGRGTGFAAVIAIGAALWSASSGIAALNTGLTVVNRENETRGRVKRRLLALALTLFAVAGVLVMLALVVALPSLLDSAGFSDIGSTALELARWPLLAIVLLDGLAVIYRYGPQRRRPKWRWISPGAIAAMIVGVAASIGFSIYVSLLGTYNKTYGALGAIIVVLLWLYLMAFAVLFGAALNAELEHQTAQDTTAGDERPIGERGAQVADTVGPTRTQL
jgi:membrane protein